MAMARKPKKLKPIDPQAELRRERARIAKEKHEGPFRLLFASRHPDLPQPLRDHKFAECVGRKFKLDFAWPDIKLGCELDGGGMRSRHATVKGYATDCDKVNLGIALGWRLMRYNVIHMRRMEDVVDQVAEIVRNSY
jgi:hypothetical protein